MNWVDLAIQAVATEPLADPMVSLDDPSESLCFQARGQVVYIPNMDG